MTSPTARESVEELKAKGLDPSFDDIVRLNALGLALEASKKRSIADSTYYLPRVAKISDSLAFRQPSIGHEMWFDAVQRFVREPDFQTVLAIKAFGLSRPWQDLPDPLNPSAVKIAVETFSKECADFTTDQLFAAVSYVLNGANPTDGERPGSTSREQSSDDLQDCDWDQCVAAGVLHEGEVVLWGASVADLKSLTPRQLRDMIRRAYIFHEMSSSSDDAEMDFYSALDEIEARLKSEKSSS